MGSEPKIGILTYVAESDKLNALIFCLPVRMPFCLMPQIICVPKQPLGSTLSGAKGGHRQRERRGQRSHLCLSPIHGRYLITVEFYPHVFLWLLYIHLYMYTVSKQMYFNGRLFISAVLSPEEDELDEKALSQAAVLHFSKVAEVSSWKQHILFSVSRHV